MKKGRHPGAPVCKAIRMPMQPCCQPCDGLSFEAMPMPVMLSLHIVFLILWSATLLYLPWLFLYQATITEPDRHRDAVAMQTHLYSWVMTPSALLTILAGIWLIFERNFQGGWLHAKLALVMLMVFFHAYCGKLIDDLRHGGKRHPAFYPVLAVAPAALIIVVVTLVVAKPF
jgi:putative membrane protein